MTNAMVGVLGISSGELLLILSALLLFGAVLVTVAAVVVLMLSRRGRGASTPPMAPLPTGQGQAPPPGEPLKSEYTNMAGAHFHKVNLAGADFDDVNLCNARFHNVNLNNTEISAVDLGGASFRQIGPPPHADGKQARQRPVRFEEMMLCDSTFRKVDLSNVRITECDLTGMTINGVQVTELLTAHLEERNRGAGT